MELSRRDFFTTLGLVLSVMLIVTVMLVSAGAANTQALEQGGKSENSWSALDNVDRFKGTLAKAGFGWQQGIVEYVDLVKACCLGQAPDTLANNPWPNAYVTLKFDPHPGVIRPVDWAWQLREDEAIVLIGQTPPPVAYFSYQTFMLFQPPYQITSGLPKRYGIAVGDATNIGTIHTIGPDRVNQPVVYIVTAHRETERQVRLALQKAGYPASIINVETISPAIFKLGVGKEGLLVLFGAPLRRPG